MAERRHPQAHTAALSSDLSSLGRDLNKSRARAARLWRNYQAIDQEVDPDACTIAHRAWSEAVDEALQRADAISRESARTLDDVLIQFEAIWWWIIEDDSILDRSTVGWLRRYRRSLRRLAGRAE